jgi:hypothetical protein
MRTTLETRMGDRNSEGYDSFKKWDVICADPTPPGRTFSGNKPKPPRPKTSRALPSHLKALVFYYIRHGRHFRGSAERGHSL